MPFLITLKLSVAAATAEIGPNIGSPLKRCSGYNIVNSNQNDKTIIT